MTDPVPSKERDEAFAVFCKRHVRLAVECEAFISGWDAAMRSAPEPPVVEATNGIGISAMWCALCGSKEGDGHLVGCPYAGAAQPPGGGQ